jgi:hypothetical protein
MSDKINTDRRHFLGAATMTFVATQFSLNHSAEAQSGRQKLPDSAAGKNTSFAPLKQIDAGLLSFAYAEAGPADGEPVILLHGWPYDIYSFVDVAPLLASALDIAFLCRICAVTEPRGFCPMRHSGTVNRRPSPRIPSHS